MECFYCMSKDLTMLNGTCYCKECCTYFTVENDEMIPVLIEEKKPLRKEKIKEERIFCSLCQEIEESTEKKKRIEEEHKMEITKGAPQKKRKENLLLCPQCIENVNRKLKKDKESVYPVYMAYIKRNTLFLLRDIFIVFGVQLVWSSSIVTGVLVVLREARKRRKMKAYIRIAHFLLFLFCLQKNLYFLLYLTVYFLLEAKKLIPKPIKYIENKINLKRIEEEVEGGIKRIQIGKKKKEAPSPSVSSFICGLKAPNQKNEEIEDLCKELSGMRIVSNWPSRLIEWIKRK
ncbi:hypothetical protein NEFER03_0185 [Nematocida sp. LUAm3]|nr:hypothetical protein NEFER03_0185 [Nematocida sp. LUAm3]KAI5173638.1 hypothetical protein NEFER02_0154 [Nematocida sp. LUAm2]KAI5176859.1 hypothetical protein NEFER01_0184 [Nematocida sp. LUAm1]